MTDHWKLKFLVAALLVVILVLLITYQTHQKTVAYESLQGCWNIENEIYLIFDGSSMQVLELLSDGGYNIRHEDTAIACKYLSKLSTKSHRYRITRSKSSKIDHPMFRSKSFELELYSSIGCMRIIENGKEVSRLVKNNEMTLEYLA